jgi:cellulose synthase/poly-beta-1,6-N-acetylglucosamine synthase-like glycosyltransferase
MSVDARRIPEAHVLSVIVPAYNEAETIEQVLDRVLALGDLVA